MNDKEQDTTSVWLKADLKEENTVHMHYQIESSIQSLLDFCAKIPGCSGKITLARDEFYGLHQAIPDTINDETVVNCKQDHGYCAFCLVKDVLHTGRGLTVEEAIEKLGEKLKAKFKV